MIAHLVEPLPENVVFESHQKQLDILYFGVKLTTYFASPVQSVLLLHKLEDGSFVQNFPLDMGSITGYSGRRKDTEIFYSFTSFLTPGIIYHCDMTGEELKPSVRYMYLYIGKNSRLSEPF